MEQLSEERISKLELGIETVCQMVNKRKSPQSYKLKLMEPRRLEGLSEKPRCFAVGPRMLDIIWTLMPQPDSLGCSTVTPLVCSRAGVLFLLPEGTHTYFQTTLSDIYFLDINSEYVSPDIRQSRWLAKGCGWFVSSMKADTIVVHENYRVTDHDAPVFEIWRNIQKESFEYQ